VKCHTWREPAGFPDSQFWPNFLFKNLDRKKANSLAFVWYRIVPIEDVASEEIPVAQSVKLSARESIRSYLLAICAALTVAYFAFRLFKNSWRAKA